MKKFFLGLLLWVSQSMISNAQDFAVRTNEIFLDFQKPGSVAVKGLPLINWKSPALESSISPFPSFVVEAFVSSDVELKSVTLIFSNGNVVIGQKSHDVTGLKEKKVRQKLTLNDGRNVVEIVAENINGDKVRGMRSLILGDYVPGKNDKVFTGSGNKIIVKRMELESDKLNLYYDLIDSVNSRTYSVDLYSSDDDFVSKQEKVSGDIGLEIKPGTNHKITWNAKEMLGPDFKGKFRLELRANLFVPFVQFDVMKKSYKRGKELSLNWKGKTPPTALNFDLYKGNELVFPFANIANEGKTTLRIPKSIKPGKGYYFKVSDVNNNDKMVITQTFSVKRKTPLMLKVLPFALIGGAAAALGGGGSGSGTHNIPDPLLPTH